jgi:hypothetical protein
MTWWDGLRSFAVKLQSGPWPTTAPTEEDLFPTRHIEEKAQQVDVVGELLAKAGSACYLSPGAFRL